MHTVTATINTHTDSAIAIAAIHDSPTRCPKFVFFVSLKPKLKNKLSLGPFATHAPPRSGAAVCVPLWLSRLSELGLKLLVTCHKWTNGMFHTRGVMKLSRRAVGMGPLSISQIRAEFSSDYGTNLSNKHVEQFLAKASPS
jgi:hypothetical protein